MHKIHAKEFTLDDFSHEHLSDEIVRVEFDNQDYLNTFADGLRDIVDLLNSARKLYLETKDKKYWYSMIQLLPTSYNQRRTVKLNYQVLKNMYHARKIISWIVGVSSVSGLKRFRISKRFVLRFNNEQGKQKLSYNGSCLL